MVLALFLACIANFDLQLMQFCFFFPELIFKASDFILDIFYPSL